MGAHVVQVREQGRALPLEEVGSLASVGRVEARHQVAHQRRHQLPQQLVAGAEVVAHAAEGHVGSRRDAGEGGLVEAGVADLRQRCVEDPGSGLARLGVARVLGRHRVAAQGGALLHY